MNTNRWQLLHCEVREARRAESLSEDASNYEMAPMYGSALARTTPQRPALSVELSCTPANDYYTFDVGMQVDLRGSSRDCSGILSRHR